MSQKQQAELVHSIIEANKRIRPIVTVTPFCKSLLLSHEPNKRVFFKCEHAQITGSFKIRGATNKIKLTVEQQQTQSNELKFSTASSGNHGIAVSYAAQQVGVAALVHVPRHVDASKAALIKQCGATINSNFENCLDAELEASRISQQSNGKIQYISPYNDEDVMAGQGTIGVEIVEQFKQLHPTEQLDEVYVSVGGGGLIAGIALYVKHIFPNCKVIGCQPANSSVMYQSILAGKVLQNVPEFDTMSDGTAGGIEDECITFPWCKQLVDEWVLVSEPDIKSAWLQLLRDEHLLVEGSAALTLAAMKQRQSQAQNVALLLCGRNISFEKVKTYVTNDKQ